MNDDYMSAVFVKAIGIRADMGGMNDETTLSEEEAEAIRQAGRDARQAGKGVTDNPYLQPDAMPKATGEDPVTWEQKQYLWMLGWSSVDDE